MPGQLKRRFTLQSDISKRRRRHELDGQIATLEEAVADRKLREEEQDRQKPCLRSAVFGWGRDDLRRLQEMFTSQAYTRNVVLAEREAELYSPEPPPKRVRVAMKNIDDSAGEEKPVDCPDWICMACRHRAAFRDVCLTFGPPGDGVMFCMVFASQSPFWAAFMRLRPLDPSGAAASDAPMPVLPRETHGHIMSVDTSKFFFEDDDSFRDPPDAAVPCLTFERRGLAWSDKASVLFEFLW